MRVGALFAGYGGLEMAVQAVWPHATPAWFVEYDKAPSAVLAHHWPHVPNYGDVTTVDWAAVEPVDIVTGGFPCQDVSHAGNRAGLRDGTRTGLWAHMAHAIDILRPRLVIAENVGGLLSAGADSDMERDCWCVGDNRDTHLRALGAVLGDLAELGYDARWGVVRASDAGAPHRRARVFIVAAPRDTDGSPGPGAVTAAAGGPHTDARRVRAGAADADGPGSQGTQPAQRRHMPAGGATADASGQRHGPRQDSAGLGRVDRPDADGTQQRQRPREVTGDRSVAVAADAEGHEQRQPAEPGQVRTQPGDGVDAGTVRLDFGPYAAAIQRWEHVLGRPAPAPTEPGRDGRPRLNPTFVEFLMGLPEGHVTDVPNVSRVAQLKMLGNGVVPQQAALALRLLLADEGAS